MHDQEFFLGILLILSVVDDLRQKLSSFMAVKTKKKVFRKFFLNINGS